VSGETRPAELARLAHQNLYGVSRRMVDDQPGGEADDDGQELLYRSAHPLPFLNGVMRLHSRPDAAGLIARAREWFSGRQRPSFVVFARPGDEDADLRRAARAAGMAPVMSYPEMVCEHPVALPALAPGTEIRAVEDLEGARAYWRLCGAAYPSLGFPPDVFDTFTPESLLQTDVAARVCYRDSRPVACAMVTMADEVAMVGWVATAESARRSGLAARITAEVTNLGLERGARLVSLQASPMGESVYAALGYRELFRYRVHLAPAPEG
jgi:hypothetical protein